MIESIPYLIHKSELIVVITVYSILLKENLLKHLLITLSLFKYTHIPLLSSNNHMLCTTPNRKHNHHPLSTTAPENCLPYLVLPFLSLMTHPLHQEMPPCVVIPYLEKLAYLRSPENETMKS